jgi:hypothetical protein
VWRTEISGIMGILSNGGLYDIRSHGRNLPKAS